MYDAWQGNACSLFSFFPKFWRFCVGVSDFLERCIVQNILVLLILPVPVILQILLSHNGQSWVHMSARF
jgi:hypothetical protein